MWSSALLVPIVLCVLLPAAASCNQVDIPYSYDSLPAKVVSPDGKTVADCDDKGVYLTDRRGRNKRRPRIPIRTDLAEETVTITMAFDRTSKRLAACVSLNYGTPSLSTYAELWVVEVQSCRARKIAAWYASLHGGGRATSDYKLQSWSKDGKSVVMSAEVWEGEEAADMQSVGRTTWDVAVGAHSPAKRSAARSAGKTAKPPSRGSAR